MRGKVLRAWVSDGRERGKTFGKIMPLGRYLPRMDRTLVEVEG